MISNYTFPLSLSIFFFAATPCPRRFSSFFSNFWEPLIVAIGPTERTNQPTPSLQPFSEGRSWHGREWIKWRQAVPHHGASRFHLLTTLPTPPTAGQWEQNTNLIVSRKLYSSAHRATTEPSTALSGSFLGSVELECFLRHSFSVSALELKISILRLRAKEICSVAVARWFP